MSKLKDVLLYILFLLYSATSLAQTPIQEGQNQDFNTNTYSFKQLGWNSSVTLNGYKPNSTFYLPIAKRLNPQKAMLHLKLAFSPFVTEGTKVNILFNQTVVRRLALTNNSSQELSWDIELPLTQLSPDWQDLKLAAYLKSTKNLCDSDVWIYISADSSISVSYKEPLFNGMISDLPFPFIIPAALKPVSTLFVLPDKPAAPEIFSLFKVAMRLGQLAGDSKVRLTTDFLSNLNESKKENNIILIGTAADLGGQQMTNLLYDSKITAALKNQSGILAINQSPFNPRRALMIFTARDFLGLQKAVSAFLTTEFKSLAFGKVAIIDQIQVQEITKEIGEWYQTTLKDLGYSDQSVSGIGRHKVSYSINLPNNRIPSNAKVNTLITAPIFANIDNSQIIVMMNGLKQAAYRLNTEHASWRAEIKNTAMKPGVNQLEYLIDLHYTNEHCTRENFDEVWATIHAETEFTTSFFSNFPEAMLNQLPVPFNSDPSVILPDQLSKEELNELTNLFFKFGKLFQSSSLSFNFLVSSQVNEAYIRSHDVILLGTPEANRWVKFAMEFLPVQMKGKIRGLTLPGKKMAIGDEQSTGLLELMPSPWSEGQVTFIISGDKEQSFIWATNALIDDTIRASLAGNIALINSQTSREVLNSYDTRYISFRHRLLIYLTNLGKNIFYYLENHPQFFIYLTVIVVPLIIFLRQDKKKKQRRKNK